MSKVDVIKVDGIVTEVFRSTNFNVQIVENGHNVLCTLNGRMRANRIRIMKGDKVTVEISPYDLNRGRITWRNN